MSLTTAQSRTPSTTLGRAERTGLRAGGALAAHLSDTFIVSYHSDDFSEAQDARQALAAVGALCAVLRRTAGDAQDRIVGVDAELPGLIATGWF